MAAPELAGKTGTFTPRPRVQAPDNVAKGAVFQIKTLIEHRMETGLRRDESGVTIPRKIINRFLCRCDDVVVFEVDLHEAVAANPYIEFYLCATQSSRLDFVWEEDGGALYELTHSLTVS